MAYAKRGTTFILDEEKIKRENKYNLGDIYYTIDEMAKESGLIKENKNTFMCKGDKNDLSSLWQFNFNNLALADWFTKNVKEWFWISEEEGNTDMIAYCKQHNEGVWA